MNSGPTLGTPLEATGKVYAAVRGPAAGPAVAQRKTNIRGLLVSAAVAVIGTTLVLPTHGLEFAAPDGSIGPGWWPTVLGSALLAGALAIALVSFRKPDPVPHERVSRHGLGRLGAVLLATVLYGAAWYYLHFIPVTVLFLSALMFITGGRGIKALLVFPALTAVVLYGLFKMLLQVPL